MQPRRTAQVASPDDSRQGRFATLRDVRWPRKSAWGLAVLSGILQVSVFPTPALSWLCWVALAPLIVAVLGPQSDVQVLDASGRDLRPQTLGHGFLLGYCAGILWYAGTCY